jgi:excisionase family DNA binding protein
MPRPRRDTRFLTTVQAAAVLGVPKSTLLYFIKNGRCPAPTPKTTERKSPRFDWSLPDIDAARQSLTEGKA